MAWVKLDENFADHPKISQLDASAGWLWVCGLAYCNRHATDGRIPVSVLSRISTVKNAPRSAKRLESVGLWYRDGIDYVVHDYLDYQPSKREMVEKSEKRANAGRRGGQAKRKQDASATSKPVPTRTDPTRIDEREGRNDLAVSGQVKRASEVEAWGFAKYGALTGPNLAHATKRLPIFAHELEHCSTTRGKSWGYFWKVLDSYREAQSSEAPAGQANPKQDIRFGHAQPTREEDFIGGYQQL